MTETCLGVSDQAVVAESEGVFSRRSEALNRRSGQLTARLAERAGRSESTFSFAFLPERIRSAKEAMIRAAGGSLGVNLMVKNLEACLVGDDKVKPIFQVTAEEVLCLESGNEAQLKSLTEQFTYSVAARDCLSPAESSSAATSTCTSASGCSSSSHYCTCDLLESTVEVSLERGGAEKVGMLLSV